MHILHSMQPPVAEWQPWITAATFACPSVPAITAMAEDVPGGRPCLNKTTIALTYEDWPERLKESEYQIWNYTSFFEEWPKWLDV